MQQALDQPTATPTAPPPPDSLDTVRAELARSRALLEEAKRERDLHRAIYSAGALDLDAVSALIPRTAGEASDQPAPDPASLVAAIKADKPHLFRDRPAPPRRPRPSFSAMAPAVADDSTAPLARAAQTAAQSGDRMSLLTYLRLKRTSALAAD